MLRLALFACVAIIGIMYISSLAGIVSASAERGDRSADAQRLQREHDALIAKQKALQGESGVEVEARRLGMVKPGEIPVVVTGLPGDSERDR
jgi:cell division protein FtsB